MKKFLLFLILLGFLSNGLWGQNNLRDVVVVVRPVYSDETSQFLTDFSSSLRKNGYTYAAMLIDAYAQGGFGSGFIYKNEKNGKFYIMTNRHVVMQADYVNIEISRSGNKTEEYKNCNVVAIHPNLDLALVELNDTLGFESYLPIASEKIYDGMEVFSAGFPSLGSKPSWQLGKGIISNSEVYLEELTENDTVGLIQHTAQVDPGSSGGPLIIKNDELPLKYEVVGINTWKARGRENVNIAIPSAMISSFIENYNEREDLYTQESLQAKVNDFLQVTDSDYKKILPFISYAYTAKLSVNAFEDMLKTASKDVNETIGKYFTNESPIEGLRIGIADIISRKLFSKKLRFVSIENFNTNGEPVVVYLDQDSKTISTSWIFEQGTWRIIDLSTLEIKKIDRGGVATTYGYKTSFKLEVGIPFSEFYTSSYTLAIGKTIYTFVTYDYCINFGSAKYNEILDPSKKEKNIYFGISMRLGGQVPIKLNSDIYIIPFFKGNLGIEAGNRNSMLGVNCGLLTGVEFAFRFKETKFFLAGLGCRGKYFLETVFDEIGPEVPKNSYFFDLHVGVTF